MIIKNYKKINRIKKNDKYFLFLPWFIAGVLFLLSYIYRYNYFSSTKLDIYFSILCFIIGSVLLVRTLRKK